MYLLRLALRPIRIAPLSQLISAIAVGVLLLLIGFLMWMQQSLKPLLTRLQGEQVVTAYLDSSVPSQEEQRIVDSVRTILDGVPGALDIKLTNAPQFISQVKSQYLDLGRELEGLGEEMTQIIPRYITVTGILPDWTLEKVRSITGIEQAESSKDRYRHIVGAFSTLRWVVTLLVGGICLALLSGLINLSRMNSYLHRDALQLLRHWGASVGLLAVRGMVSGLIVGVLGGMVALAGWMTTGIWLARHVRSLSSILKGMPLPHPHLALILLAAGGIVGMLAGILGSLGSHSRDSSGGAEA